MIRSIRNNSLPLFILLLLALGGCSGTPERDLSQYEEPIFSYDRIVPDDIADVGEVYDPWQGMNKRIYNFNYHFDRKVFIPVTNAWRRYMPEIIRQGVHNFFNNIRDVRTLANSILQLSPEKTAQSAGRVLVNSTVGIFGLIDVATDLDFPRPYEDFGQTLGHYGVGQGPYLVVPFLGPSNLRDGVGMLPDFYILSETYGGFLAKPLRSTIWLFDSVDSRANVPFRYYETGSAFEYETVRWLWSIKRDLDIEK